MIIQQLTPREKKLAVVTAVFVLAALLYRLIIAPQLTRIGELENRADDAGIRILEMEHALALSERIDAKYKAYEQAIAQKGTNLEEQISFLRTVDSLTSGHEMKVLEQTPLPIELGSYYKLFSVRLGVSTRPVWLARFLAQLGKSSELVRVEDIKVTAIDDAENLSVSIKLTKVVAIEENPK